MNLSAPEVRVLGALLEKEITTPDIYPLSLNALQAASNQRSSRDPVLDLSEGDVRQALHDLEELGLASPARSGLSGGSSRVVKYEHHARTVLQLRRDEVALLCLLLLRGPQTPGELRARADRLFAFDDLQSVVTTLERLASRTGQEGTSPATGPLVMVLARQRGSREARYVHLLGAFTPDAAEASETAGAPTDLPARMAELEVRLSTLEERLAQLEGRAPKAE